MAGPNVIEIVLKASNQASAELDRANQSVKRFGLSSVAAFAGVTLGVAGAIAATTKWIKAANEAALADSSLADAMKRHAIYSDAAFEATKRFASALSLTTWATDEQIKNMQAIFINFGAYGDGLNKLTQLSLDFAAAQGLDVVSASQMVARAWLGESQTLGRLNLGIEGASGSMERLLSMWEKGEAAWGGKAQADIQNTAGSWHQLGKAIGEAGETVGGWINKIAAPLAGGVATMINLALGIKAVGDAATTAGPAVSGYLSKLHQWNVEVTTAKANATDFIGTMDARMLAMYGLVSKNLPPGELPLAFNPEAAGKPSGISLKTEAEIAAAQDAINARLAEGMALAQQFGSVISGGIANSLVSAATAGDKFLKVLGQGLGRLALQIIEMIIQMRIMKALMGSSTFMGWFGLPAMLMAGGGKIPGAYNGILVGGTPGRDSIPIMASPGERVLSKTGNENLERLIGQLASGGGGNQIHIHLGPAIDNESLRYALRYGSLGRELARAGGF